MPYGKYISLQNSCKKRNTEKVQYYAFGGLYKLTHNVPGLAKAIKSNDTSADPDTSGAQRPKYKSWIELQMLMGKSRQPQ